MSTQTDYDFSRDNAAILKDHAAGDHSPTEPFVVYQDGAFKRAFYSYGDACDWGYKQGIMGRCTVRDAFAPLPTLGPLFGAGYEAGYLHGLKDAAKIADAQVQHPGGGHPLHQGYWKAGAETIRGGIRALITKRSASTIAAEDAK